MDIIEIPVEKRLEICRAIAQFGEPRLPTKKELENPSYVLPSRKIGLKDVEDFIGVLNEFHVFEIKSVQFYANENINFR